MQQLPYDRGNLFATLVDGELRRASDGARSLDDVMLAMRRGFENSPLPIRASFVAAMNGQGIDIGRELDEIHRRWQGDLPRRGYLRACGKLVTEDRPNFNRGFDIDATMKNNNHISGVDPGLPAYRAGMRDGMTIIKREAGVIGDSSQELAYRVSDAGTERVIRYMPRGHGTTPTQSFGAARGSCRGSAARLRAPAGRAPCN